MVTQTDWQVDLRLVSHNDEQLLFVGFGHSSAFRVLVFFHSLLKSERPLWPGGFRGQNFGLLVEVFDGLDQRLDVLLYPLVHSVAIKVGRKRLLELDLKTSKAARQVQQRPCGLQNPIGRREVVVNVVLRHPTFR